MGREGEVRRDVVEENRGRDGKKKGVMAMEEGDRKEGGWWAEKGGDGKEGSRGKDKSSLLLLLSRIRVQSGNLLDLISHYIVFGASWEGDERWMDEMDGCSWKEEHFSNLSKDKDSVGDWQYQTDCLLNRWSSESQMSCGSGWWSSICHLSCTS